MHVGLLIADAATRFASRTALIEIELSDSVAGSFRERRRVTYGELYEKTLRLCSALAGRGLDPGERVAVLLGNSVEMVVTEWACLQAGYVWVGLNTRSSGAEIGRILADSRPALLVTSDDYAAVLAEVDLPPGCEVVRVGGDSCQWDALLAAGDVVEPAASPRENAPVRIRYTSGTAGRPKGAVVPRRGYDASIETVTDVIGPLTGDDVLVQVAPMTHASGAMLLPHAAVGASALLVDRFEPRALIEIVARYRATAVFLVPTMLVRLIEHVDAPTKLASLRTVVYGGASMPIDRLLKAVDLLGPVFVQIYGLTESTWPVTALSRRDHLRREGEDERSWHSRLRSCGKPTSVGEVRVVDPDGRDLPPGEAGEFLVRGRNTMVGYWQGPALPPRPEASEEETDKGLDADGWMHTGDVANLDAEGNVTIVDRLHDMIVSGGFNVYPREVEDALSSHPAVLECAVVGRPSEEWGETVHAYVVLREGAVADPGELAEHCAERTAGYKKPRSIEIVASLPRGPSGKVLRRELKRRLAGVWR